MSGGYISYFVWSQYFSDADLQNLLPDLQAQVANEFNWYWGLYAYLDDSGSGSPVIILDSTNDPNPVPGALGYHAIDGNCNPFAIVYPDLCVANGIPISGVISHETLEMLGDQLTDVAALYPNVSNYPNYTGNGFIILQEVCDPCEMILYYEGPNGNVVSDFVTPAWYAPGCPPPYDFLGAIPNAWQLASGGYVCYQAINLPGWTCPAADEARKVAAKAGEMLTRIENPAAGAIRQLRSKGMQVETPPTREITVVKQKDVAKVGESRRAPKGRPQIPVPATSTPIKAQKIPEQD